MSSVCITPNKFKKSNLFCQGISRRITIKLAEGTIYKTGLQPGRQRNINSHKKLSISVAWEACCSHCFAHCKSNVQSTGTFVPILSTQFAEVFSITTHL